MIIVSLTDLTPLLHTRPSSCPPLLNSCRCVSLRHYTVCYTSPGIVCDCTISTLSWAARYITGLLIKLTPKDVVFSFYPPCHFRSLPAPETAALADTYHITDAYTDRRHLSSLHTKQNDCTHKIEQPYTTCVSIHRYTHICLIYMPYTYM